MNNKDIGERTFRYAVRIVKLCSALESKSNVTSVLVKQLLRSGTSIGANISEAQSGQSKRDFINKVEVSLKEARESLYWIRLLIASEIVPKHLLTSLEKETDEIIRILVTIAKNAKTNPDR